LIINGCNPIITSSTECPMKLMANKSWTSFAVTIGTTDKKAWLPHAKASSESCGACNSCSLVQFDHRCQSSGRSHSTAVSWRTGRVAVKHLECNFWVFGQLGSFVLAFDDYH